MTVLADAPPPRTDAHFTSAGSALSADSGADHFSDSQATCPATTRGPCGAIRTSSTRAVLTRKSREDRWEAEVARGLGTGAARSERFERLSNRMDGLDTRSTRNEARVSMKSAGERLHEFGAHGGSGVNDEECMEAEERAKQRLLDKEMEAAAAAAAKAAERAARLLAKRSKAKHVQLRHELRIRETEARKTALRTQVEHETEVLRDITVRRRDAQRLLAEREAQDDSLECVLRWALPEAGEPHDPEIRDDAAALRLMAKGGDKGLDDDGTVLKLMSKGGGKVQDDDAVLKLMAQGQDNFRNDDDAARRLMGKEPGKFGDENSVRAPTAKGPADTGTELLRLMRKGADVDNATVQRLMTKADRGGRDDSAALRVSQEANKSYYQPTAAQDDEAMRIILDSACDRNEAKINADALRCILGGAADPVARLAHLARTRPKSGRSRADAEAAQAGRDLQVLNNLIEKSDLDNEIQAWKDVGAIHMLMQDMAGPDPEKRMRANQLQEDSNAVEDLMGVSYRPSSGYPPSGGQATSDELAVQRLLGQAAHGNLLQPPNLAYGGASGSPLSHNPLQPGAATNVADNSIIQKMMWRQPGPTTTMLDTNIVQNLMGVPLSGNSLSGPTAMAVDTNIIQQLMSRPAMPGAATFPPSESMRGFLGRSNGAPPAMGPYASGLRDQDASVARSLMGAPPEVAEVQILLDVDALNRLIF